MGKLLISHRYNRIPLLNSLPGGFYRSWSYKTYPSAKVTLFFKSAKRKRKIRKKSRRAAHLRTGTEETTRESSRIPAPHDVPSGTGAFVSRPPFGCPRQPHGASSRPKPRPDRRRLGKTANFVCFCARLALSLFENSRQCVANSSSASASSSYCSQASASTSATFLRKLRTGTTVALRAVGIGVPHARRFARRRDRTHRLLPVLRPSYRTRPVVQTRALRAGTGNERRTSSTYAQTGIADARAGDDQ